MVAYKLHQNVHLILRHLKTRYFNRSVSNTPYTQSLKLTLLQQHYDIKSVLKASFLSFCLCKKNSGLQ